MDWVEYIAGDNCLEKLFQIQGIYKCIPACTLPCSCKWGPVVMTNNYYYYALYSLSAFWLAKSPPAYFENSRDFVDRHDYSIICYPIISADYIVCSVIIPCAPLAKERESWVAGYHKSLIQLLFIIIHSKYFFLSDWLKPHA